MKQRRLFVSFLVVMALGLFPGLALAENAGGGLASEPEAVAGNHATLAKSKVANSTNQQGEGTLLTIQESGDGSYPWGDESLTVGALSVDALVTVTFDEANGVWYSFTPSADGKYRFSSASDEEGIDPCVTFWWFDEDEGWDYKEYDDVYGAEGDLNFSFARILEEGVTYYLYASTYSSSDDGSYELSVSEEQQVTSFEVNVRDDAPLYFGDMDYGYYNEDDGEDAEFRFHDSQILDLLSVIAIQGDAAEGVSYPLDRDNLQYGMVSAGDETLTVTVNIDGVEKTVEFSVLLVSSEFEGATSVALGESPSMDQNQWLEFTPAKSGKYGFASSAEYYSAYVYDADGHALSSSDNGVAMLEKGVKYYVNIISYDDDDSFTLTVSNLKAATSVTAAVKDGGYLYFDDEDDSDIGYWSSYYDEDADDELSYYRFYSRGVYGVLNVTAKYDDGTTGTVEYEDIDDVIYDERKVAAGGSLAVKVELDGVTSNAVSIPVYASKTDAEKAQAEAKAKAEADAKAKAEAAAKAEAEAKAKAEAAKAEANLANATVSVAAAGAYTGKAKTPAVAVVSKGGKTLASGTDYAVAYKDNVNAGTATVTVTGKGNYTGSKAATFTVEKAANTLTVKAKSPAVKAASVKKKAQAIAVKKAFAVSKAKGKVTYKKASGNKKITVSKAGKITVKKGLKKGTYKVKVKVTAAGNANYKKATKTVTVKVKVK